MDVKETSLFISMYVHHVLYPYIRTSDYTSRQMIGRIVVY